MAAYDSQMGQGRSSLPDRLTRYLTNSAALHAILAPVTYLLFQRAAETDAASLLDETPLMAFVPGAIYVALPAVLGIANAVVGRRSGRSLAGQVLSLLPERWQIDTTTSAPSSWDHLFVGRGPAYVRLRLRSGGWVGGFWGTHVGRGIDAHAALYPEARDLYLPQVAGVDDQGKFVLDEHGDILLYDEGVLVRWDDVDVLKFTYVDVAVTEAVERSA